MICTVKPLFVIWLNSHTQEHMKLCSKQKGQLFPLHLRIKHEEDEQNWSSTLNTRIIVPPCHIFTCAFWPLWAVYALCHMGTYFGTFYFKNCLRMPTHSSTVPSLSIPANPSQDNLNCTVSCRRNSMQHSLLFPGKTKQNKSLSLISALWPRILLLRFQSDFSSMLIWFCLFALVEITIMNIRMEHGIENNRMWIIESYSSKL